MSARLRLAVSWALGRSTRKPRWLFTGPSLNSMTCGFSEPRFSPRAHPYPPHKEPPASASKPTLFGCFLLCDNRHLHPLASSSPIFVTSHFPTSRFTCKLLRMHPMGSRRHIVRPFALSPAYTSSHTHEKRKRQTRGNHEASRHQALPVEQGRRQPARDPSRSRSRIPITSAGTSTATMHIAPGHV